MLHRRLFIAFVIVPIAVLLLTPAFADDTRSFTMRVETPPLRTSQDVPGFETLELEGFDSRSRRVGAPDVPHRTYLVAIPDGATARLTFERPGATHFRALNPRPVPRLDLADRSSARHEILRGLATTRAGQSLELEPRYEADLSQYSGEGTLPTRLAWLGEIGTLRRQRYVALHVAPVRYDRVRQGLAIESALELTVHFDGDWEARSAAEEPLLESVYQSSFINYGQGRDFRLPFDALQPEPPKSATPQALLGVGGPIRRIKVTSDGLLRLDHSLIAAEAPEFLLVDPRNWMLMNRGVQVPLDLRQSGGDDALFEPGEWVQFFGEAVAEESTALNLDNPESPSERLFAVTDFGNENAYFLTDGGAPQPLMTERDATPAGGVPLPYFIDTAHEEVDDPSFFFPLPEELFYWPPFTTESSGSRTESVPLPGLLSGTEPAQIRVSVYGFIDCISNPADHETVVNLINDFGQTMQLPASNPDNFGNFNLLEYDGHTLGLHDFGWSYSGGDPQLTDPVSVRLQAASVPGNCPEGGQLNNESLLNWIEIDYRREFMAVGDRLDFSLPDGDELIEIRGFLTSSVDVYEVTDLLPGGSVVDAVKLTGVTTTFVPGDGRFKAAFRVDDGLSGADRQFVAVGLAGPMLPGAGNILGDRVSEILSDTTQADLIVIAHPDVIDSTCTVGGNPCELDVDCVGGAGDRCEISSGSELDLLLAHRASQGISSRVVRVQDLEDEFNAGIPGPQAIRNFLTWIAGGGWSGDLPSFVMLLGDGSFDYAGGTAGGNFVPTQILVHDQDDANTAILPYYTSDSLLAAVSGADQLAEFAVGRITCRSLAEADTILSKIRLFEQSPPVGDWQRRSLFISDKGVGSPVQAVAQAKIWCDMNEVNAIDRVEATGEPYLNEHLMYWFDNCIGMGGSCDAVETVGSCDPELMRQDILDAMDKDLGGSAALVQYAGHGNFDLWSNDVIFCANSTLSLCDDIDDASLLDNGLRLPLLMVHNCLTGGFHTTELESFAEQWFKRDGNGALAVYAPSGLGFGFIGKTVTDVLFEEMFGRHKARRIGAPVLASQAKLCGDNSFPECQHYVLIGDPSSSVGLPDVGAPQALTADASDDTPVATVDLNWTASSTPGATYRIYRQQQGQSGYVVVENSVAGTSYLDGGLEPTETYEYYVVAVENEFESAWSNFNTTCGVSPGPDCVQASPLNLTPPVAPTLIAVTDAEIGGVLNINWLDAVEPDVVEYIIHYGPTAAFGQTKLVSALAGATSANLTELVDGQPYHVAMRARNSSNALSAFSPTMIETPNLVLGVKAPGFVTDLRLGRAGDDALLTWGAVTEDIYGKALSISSYEIYRGTTPTFLPAIGNRIGVVGSPSFTDFGALTPGGADYHYLVRAVDGLGNPGGLGRQLPDGVRDLQLQPGVAPGSVKLTWSPVLIDFDGAPTTIAHYQVYASDQPFTRADIQAGSIPLIVPTASAAGVEIIPAGPIEYYSVLAVDQRGNRSPF